MMSIMPRVDPRNEDSLIWRIPVVDSEPGPTEGPTVDPLARGSRLWPPSAEICVAFDTDGTWTRTSWCGT